MVLGELLCCLAALGGPLGDSWEVLGDPWRLALVVLRAFLGTSWRSLGGSGAPLIDFVDFPLTLKIMEKPYVFACFRQQGNGPGLFHGGTGLIEACRSDPGSLRRSLRTPGCGPRSVH